MCIVTMFATARLALSLPQVHSFLRATTVWEVRVTRNRVPMARTLPILTIGQKVLAPSV
jgi:hypothetical protein